MYTHLKLSNVAHWFYIVFGKQWSSMDTENTEYTWDQLIASFGLHKLFFTIRKILNITAHLCRLLYPHQSTDDAFSEQFIFQDTINLWNRQDCLSVWMEVKTYGLLACSWPAWLSCLPNAASCVDGNRHFIVCSLITQDMTQAIYYQTQPLKKICGLTRKHFVSGRTVSDNMLSFNSDRYW